MNLYISADIEGCTGIASFSQCGRADKDHYDYPFARRMMTHDVNAVVRGARMAGAKRILIKDGHGNCKNLLIDELEQGVELISGQGPTPDGMMDGMNASFDAAMLVGYHGRAGLSHAMMDHALVGSLHSFWINGKPAGEILVSAAVAGAYGKPLVLVTSDEAGCEEARHDIIGVETYSTKEGLGKYMGRMKSDTTHGLERAAKRGLERIREIEPIVYESEVHMKASFRTTEEVDLASTLEGITRKDGYSLEWTRDSFLEAHRVALNVFQFAIAGRGTRN